MASQALPMIGTSFSTSFRPIILPIAVDLIGHGDSESPENTDLYSCDAIVGHLIRLSGSSAFPNLYLADIRWWKGGSFLYYQISLKVKAVILESTSPGIEEICAKKQRVELDLLLADKS